MKISKKYLLTLFAIFILSVSVLYFFNQKSGLIIEKNIKSLAFSEGKTISEVMKTAGLHLLEEGEDKLISFLNKEFDNNKVVYFALLKNNNLFYADTKFEGYLPIDRENKNIRIIKSPRGKIIEISSNIDFHNILYQIKIGYLFDSLSIVKQLRNRNLITMTLIQILIIVIMLLFVYHFNNILREKEIEIQKEKDEKEKYQEISIIMAGINHEIKNPLNSLYLSYQIVDKYVDKSNEEAVFYAKSLKNEIKRISDILDKYGNVNKKIKVNNKKISAIDIFKELEFIFRGISDKIILKKEFNINSFITDPDLLKQLFINLYKNSYEANATKITIKIFKEKKYIKIVFEDNGEGVKEPEKIFIPFYSTKERNSGLGMVIIKRIITALNGKIEVESSPKKGTIISILLREGKIE